MSTSTANGTFSGCEPGTARRGEAWLPVLTEIENGVSRMSASRTVTAQGAYVSRHYRQGACCGSACILRFIPNTFGCGAGQYWNEMARDPRWVCTVTLRGPAEESFVEARRLIARSIESLKSLATRRAVRFSAIC